jgi:NAD(P)-dependent dehydrogenase (short-subunit alcohol dehydrogenase family)
VAVEIDLSGHRALVTGGGQGVGRGISRMLGAAGAEVLVNDLVAERCDAVVGEIVDAGGRAVPAPFDVTAIDAVRDAIGRLGAVDILVNNAGNAGQPDLMGSFELDLFVDTDPASWDRYVKVNFYGVMNCAHACLPGMIQAQWGRIVTIISDASRAGDARNAVYAGAKAAAAGFTRSVATEGGRHGITANNISLATMNSVSPEARPQLTDEQLVQMEAATKQALRNYVVRRRGEPEDVAGMVTYLVSPMASWVTGQTIPVNGGYTMAL